MFLISELIHLNIGDNRFTDPFEIEQNNFFMMPIEITGFFRMA